MHKMMIKKATYTLTLIICLMMAIISILEKTEGTEYAKECYSSIPFIGIWCIIAICSIIVMKNEKMWKNKAVFLLHTAFLVILAGAMTSHLIGEEGIINVRVDNPTTIYRDRSNNVKQLPFIIGLDSFKIVNYPGTDIAEDYISCVTVNDQGEKSKEQISMNHILRHKGYRFYQSSYDEDREGTILSISHDPIGVGITYSGYALLVIAMFWLLIDKNGKFRKTIADLGKQKHLTGVIVLFALFSNPQESHATATLSENDANAVGSIWVMHNGYVSTFETLAQDFTKKLYGKSSYNGNNASQVLCGWIVNYEDWSREKMIEVKSDNIRKIIGCGKYASLCDFFTPEGTYKLAYLHNTEDLNSNSMKDLRTIEEKLGLIEMLQKGSLLSIFPYSNNRKEPTVWYTPTSSLPDAMPNMEKMLVTRFFDLIAQKENIPEIVAKFKKYQSNQLGEEQPSALHDKTEHFNNNYNYTKPLSMVSVTIGLLSLIGLCIGSSKKDNTFIQTAEKYIFAIGVLIWIATTILLAVRIILSGRLPLSNGYETMLLIGWMASTSSLFLKRVSVFFLPLGIMLSGFALLVASLNNMNPQITQLMPVLNSPWLSIHVTMMMISYTLLGYLALNGLTCMMMVIVGKKSKTAIIKDQVRELTKISQSILYPAVFILTAGVFAGAVWANVSWGNYWSWDPKETWALITMLIYALPMHQTVINSLKTELGLQTYLTIAFISVLMTFFGVNYLLGGMHSYAQGTFEEQNLVIGISSIVIILLILLVIYSNKIWNKTK